MHFLFACLDPVYIVIMRNSRGKLFVYVAVLGVLCFIVFLLSSTHTSLKELESVNEKCQQQRDSLSAQLQGNLMFLFCIDKILIIEEGKIDI